VAVKITTEYPTKYGNAIGWDLYSYPTEVEKQTVAAWGNSIGVHAELLFEYVATQIGEDYVPVMFIWWPSDGPANDLAMRDRVRSLCLLRWG